MVNKTECIADLSKFYEECIKYLEINKSTLNIAELELIDQLKEKSEFLEGIKKFLLTVNYKPRTFIEVAIQNTNGNLTKGRLIKDFIIYKKHEIDKYKGDQRVKVKTKILDSTDLSDSEYLEHLISFIDTCCDETGFKPTHIDFRDVLQTRDEAGKINYQESNDVYRLYKNNNSWYVDKIETKIL